MSYRGKTYRLPCGAGGLTANPNVDMIPPVSMLHPTRNLNLDESGRRKRGGTAHANAFAFTDKASVMGLVDFTLTNGNQFIIAAGKDGKIYKGTDASTTLKTGMSTTNYYHFETFDDELFVCDGATKPQTWDGSAGSTSDITSVPTDWSGSNYPKQLIKHGRGASERLWAIGALPDKIYAGANGDGNDFSDANVVTLTIQTADGHGIVGGIEFGDRLMVFGKRQAFIIDDADFNTANWGYDSAQWEGGAAHWRLICKTPNDLVCMMEDGEVYSVLSAESYGDYKMASLTRGSFMHKYIKEYINLAQINKFHMVYDPVLRAVKIFCVRNGQTNVDTALVYFIDRKPEEAWMVHDNQDSTSGYTAFSSAIVRASVGDYQVYTGDDSGQVWKLEQETREDDTNGYYAGFRTPRLTFDNPRIDKRFVRGFLITKPEGDWSVTIDWWVDGVQQAQKSVSLAGTGAALGSFTLGTDVLGGDELIDTMFELKAKGKRIQLEVYNSSRGQGFFISQILVDYKPLGAEPT